MPDPLATNHLSLPYLAAAQAQKHVTHNESLRTLDSVVQIAVIDMTVTDPPSEPAEGDRYIVPASATGDWSDHEHDVADYVDGAWAFLTPSDGWVAFDIAGSVLLIFDDAAWQPVGTFIGTVDRLGVNTTADETNRLAVRSEAVLFSGIDAGDGGTGDLRLVFNKEADGDTASLLFQSGFSGRAEIGLAGDTDLIFKVSANGTDWIESIRIDNASGLPSILYDNGSSGLVAATIQDAIDEIAGVGGGGAVDSVFGRTGAVAAAASDYDADQIDFAPAGGIAATDVQAAIEELDSEKAAASHGHAAGDITSGTLANARVAEGNVTQHQAALSITESQISDLDHTDADALHDDVAGEIAAMSEKASPVSGDLLVIEDSADSNNKKKVQLGNLPGGGGGSVDSIFGRTGAVAAAASDYDANQIDFAPAGGIAATDVQAAIEELDSEKAATGHGHTKADVGLGNVDNTSDVNKPVSTAQQTALDAKLALVAFAGTVLSGCLLSNSSDATNDIDIAPGYCLADDGSTLIQVPALTKRLNATWVVGDGNGGRDSSDSLVNGTWFVWAIRRSDTEVVDVMFSDDLSPSLPANYDAKCLIAPVPRVSGSLVAFSQHGNEFLLDEPYEAVDVTNLGTSATLYPLATVPTGVKVLAKLHGQAGEPTASTTVRISSPDQADTAPTGTNNNARSIASAGDFGVALENWSLDVRTDTSGQVRARSSSAGTTLIVIVEGWYWNGA